VWNIIEKYNNRDQGFALFCRPGNYYFKISDVNIYFLTNETLKHKITCSPFQGKTILIQNIIMFQVIL